MSTTPKQAALIAAAIAIAGLSQAAWSQKSPTLQSQLRAPAISATQAKPGNPLVGRWASVDTDKETGDTETLLLDFRADGTYETLVRSTQFAPSKQHARGRYDVSAADKSGFTLTLKRQMDEPESDKKDAIESDRIRIVDDNTLQASDGSIVRRAK